MFRDEYDNFGNKSTIQADDSFNSVSSNYSPPPGMIGDKVNDPTAPNSLLSGGTASNLQVDGVVKVGKDEDSAGVNTGVEPSDIVFWAGSSQEDRDTAPFRVDLAGNVNMTSATIADVPVLTKGFFGGDGSDGALSIASGTTTLDLGNAKVFTKNYTSISITGTGQLTFSNPHASGSIIVLKATGNVTLTSSASPNIEASGMGAAGGAGGAAGGGTGSSGTTAVPLSDPGTEHRGTGGASGGPVGAAGAIYANTGLYTISPGRYYAFGRFISPGSGGGGGAGGDTGNTGGAGGRGGGALVIECAGDLNCTGNINAKGSNGANGTVGASTDGSDGGGGSGGSCLVFYNTATATSGTISDAGGNGGTQNSGGANSGGGGAGGIGGAGASGQGTSAGGGGGGGGAAASGSTGGAASTSADHFIQV